MIKVSRITIIESQIQLINIRIADSRSEIYRLQEQINELEELIDHQYDKRDELFRTIRELENKK